MKKNNHYKFFYNFNIILNNIKISLHNKIYGPNCKYESILSNARRK